MSKAKKDYLKGKEFGNKYLNQNTNHEELMSDFFDYLSLVQTPEHWKTAMKGFLDVIGTMSRKNIQETYKTKVDGLVEKYLIINPSLKYNKAFLHFADVIRNLDLSGDVELDQNILNEKFGLLDLFRSDAQRIISEVSDESEKITEIIETEERDEIKKYREKHPPGEKSRIPKGHKIVREGLEKIAEEGRLTLEEIGEHYGGVTRERARQILEKEGLHAKWKKARERYKQMGKNTLKQLAEKLAGKLYFDFVEKTKEKPFPKAYQKALEYRFNRKSVKTYSFDSLVEFFEGYYLAKERGEKLSLEELGKPSGISPQSTGRILEEVGEESLYGARERKLLTKEQIRFVERAIKSSARLNYIAMGKIAKDSKGWEIPYYIFVQRALKRKIKRDAPIAIHLGFRKGKVSLPSSIDLFEALDAGFSKEEAMEYAGIRTDRAFETVLSRRKEIEEEISKFKADVDFKGYSLERISQVKTLEELNSIIEDEPSPVKYCILKAFKLPLKLTIEKNFDPESIRAEEVNGEIGRILDEHKLGEQYRKKLGSAYVGGYNLVSNVIKEEGADKIRKVLDDINQQFKK